MSKDWISEFDPSPEDLKSILRARKSRRDQRKSRGDKASAKDSFEDAAMILAYEAGEVSEGVLSKVVCDGNRVELREKRLRLIALGRNLAHALRILG